MADAHPRPEDFRVLEQSRMRIHQIASSLEAMKRDMMQTSTLPTWDSLTTSEALLTRTIERMTAHLTQHDDLLQRIVVHPSANFPGRTQEGLLMQILRKKLEPQTEEWVAVGRSAAAMIDQARAKDDDELWDWAGEFYRQRMQSYIRDEFGGEYTAAEEEMGVENVRTGLKVEYEDEDEDEDEDEEMKDVGTEIMDAADTVTTAPEAETKPVGLKRRLSDTMRYITSGDPVRYYASDLELLAKSNTRRT